MYYSYFNCNSIIKVYLSQSIILKMIVLSVLQKIEGPCGLLIHPDNLHPCCAFPMIHLLLMLLSNKLIDLLEVL